MASFIISFLAAQAFTELSGINFTQILMNEFNKIKSRPDFDPTKLKEGIKYNYYKPRKLDVFIEVFPFTTVKGLSLLTFQELNLDLNPVPVPKFDLTLKYFVPKLRGEGFYKLHGKAFNLVPIKGNGPFWIQIEDISGFVNLTIAHNGTQFAVEKLKFDVNFKKIKHYFHNLFLNGLSRITNTIMVSFSKKFAYKLIIKNPDVMQDVIQMVKKLIDHRLALIHSYLMNYVVSYIGLKS